MFHRMKVVNGQQEIVVACRLDEGFRREGVGVFHGVEGFDETEMGP